MVPVVQVVLVALVAPAAAVALVVPVVPAVLRSNPNSKHPNFKPPARGLELVK